MAFLTLSYVAKPNQVSISTELGSLDSSVRLDLPAISFLCVLSSPQGEASVETRQGSGRRCELSGRCSTGSWGETGRENQYEQRWGKTGGDNKYEQRWGKTGGDNQYEQRWGKAGGDNHYEQRWGKTGEDDHYEQRWGRTGGDNRYEQRWGKTGGGNQYEHRRNLNTIMAEGGKR